MMKSAEIERSIVEEACEHPKLRRGKVWCRTCGREQDVDSKACFKHGWPKCCGYTMTIDSPEERRKP